MPFGKEMGFEVVPLIIPVITIKTSFNGLTSVKAEEHVLVFSLDRSNENMECSTLNHFVVISVN